MCAEGVLKCAGGVLKRAEVCLMRLHASECNRMQLTDARMLCSDQMVRANWSMLVTFISPPHYVDLKFIERSTIKIDASRRILNSLPGSRSARRNPRKQNRNKKFSVRQKLLLREV